jgi:hypothetical protein
VEYLRDYYGISRTPKAREIKKNHGNARVSSSVENNHGNTAISGGTNMAAILRPV